MRKFGPKALLRLSAGTTLLGAQLAAVAKFLPGAQPVVVTGFEAERVHKELPPGVMAVENESYDDFNVGRSLELGCRVCVRPRLLVLYGDLVLGESFLDGVPRRGSWAFLGVGGREEVGTNVSRGRVETFSYAAQGPKWAQAVLLDGEELACFKQGLRINRDRMGHELLNWVLERNGVIRSHPAGPFREVDSVQDLNAAREWVS
jgi:hypothetical protein